MSTNNTLNRWLTRIANVQLRWWIWPMVLFLGGALALASSLLLHPEGHEFVYLPNGTQFGETCASITIAGFPCPQCGMTRSWVYAARGQLITSFLHSPGGLGLFLWTQVGAVIGAARLLKRDPAAWTPPTGLLLGWIGVWLVLLYALPWIARLFGINPLPS